MKWETKMQRFKGGENYNNKKYNTSSKEKNQKYLSILKNYSSRLKEHCVQPTLCWLPVVAQIYALKTL